MGILGVGILVLELVLETYGKRFAGISAKLVSHWYEAIVRDAGGVVIGVAVPCMCF